MTRLRRTIAFLAAGTLVAASLNVLTASTATAAPFGYNQLNNIQKRLVSGLLASELNGADASQCRAQPGGAGGWLPSTLGWGRGGGAPSGRGGQQPGG